MSMTDERSMPLISWLEFEAAVRLVSKIVMPPLLAVVNKPKQIIECGMRGAHPAACGNGVHDEMAGGEIVDAAVRLDQMLFDALRLGHGGNEPQASRFQGRL